MSSVSLRAKNPSESTWMVNSKKTTPAPDPISIAYGAGQKPTIAYTQHLGGIWYAGAIDEVAIFEGALS